jgi:hypothetical protein
MRKRFSMGVIIGEQGRGGVGADRRGCQRMCRESRLVDRSHPAPGVGVWVPTAVPMIRGGRTRPEFCE